MSTTFKEDLKAFWTFNNIRKEETGIADLKAENKIITED
jgi:hypothetical protein